MPDFGSPVAQNVQSPNIATTLSGLMGLKQQQQQLQIGANTAQAADQTMQERQRVTQMMRSGVDDQGNSIRNATGEPDPAKVLPALGRMAPLTGQQYAQSVLATHTAKVGLQSAALSLDANQRAALMGPLQAVATNPNDPSVLAGVPAALDSWAAAHPQMAGIIENVKKTLLPAVLNAPADQRAHMANSMAALLQGGQKVETQPAGASVDNGQQVEVGTTAPPVAGGGFVPGSATQKQLPPTATTMVNGQPQYVGPQAPAAAGAAPTPSGPAIGQVEGVTGPIAANNAHFSQVQADAAPAQNRIASLQTIKEQLPAALTGGGDWRRKILSQLSGVFGLGNDAQTANDVMAKNLAVLASQGGNTDAARVLGEMANPSYHMTREAATKAADQLMGIESKKVAAGQFFAGTPTNSPQYAQKMAQWNQVADPRAFEFAAKSPEDQAKMKAELVKAGTWNGLANKMRALHALGVEPP